MKVAVIPLESEPQRVLQFATRLNGVGLPPAIRGRIRRPRLPGHDIVGRAAGRRTAFQVAGAKACAFKVAALEVGMVEEVEEVETEFQSVVLSERPVLPQLHVKVARRRTVAGSAAGGTNRAQLIPDEGKRPRIKDLVPVSTRATGNPR